MLISSSFPVESLRPADYTTPGVAGPLRSRRFGVEISGGEILPHLLVSGLDEFGVVEDFVQFGRGSVAADVLFLDHVPKMRPLADTVADVLENLPLPLKVVRTAEDLVPKRSVFLGHALLLMPSRRHRPAIRRSGQRSLPRPSTDCPTHTSILRHSLPRAPSPRRPQGHPRLRVASGSSLHLRRTRRRAPRSKPPGPRVA